MRTPPKLATWLLKRFEHGPHIEAVLGDLLERYQQDPIPAWYWRQVYATIVVGLRDQVSTKGMAAMKKAALWTLLIMSAFTLGFWTGRSPLAQVEELSPEELSSNGAYVRRMSSSLDPFGAGEFLQNETLKALARNRRENTPESKQRVEEFRRKLEDFRRHLAESHRGR